MRKNNLLLASLPVFRPPAWLMTKIKFPVYITELYMKTLGSAVFFCVYIEI